MTTTGLSQLIATIETLEKRLWGSVPAGDQLSNPDRIERVLLDIDRQDHSRFSEKEGVLRPRFDLVGRVRTRLQPIHAGDGGLRLMSLRQAAILQYVDDLFHGFFLPHSLDLSAFSPIHALPLAITRLLLHNPEALEGQSHPAYRFCEQLIESLRGYDVQAGRLAQGLAQRLEQMIETSLIQPALLEESNYEEALAKLAEIVEDTDQSAQRFVQYLISKESGEASRGDARQLVNQAIMEAVAGHRVPIVFVQFLAKIWSKYLFVTYLRQGTQSEEWRHGIQDIKLLADGLAIQNPAELQRYLDTHLSQTLTRFRVAAGTIYGDPSLSEEFFNTIDRTFQEIQSGKVPTAKYMTVAQGEGLGKDTEHSDALSAAERQRIDQLSIGQWFFLRQGKNGQRCRLVARNQEHDYCLFANLSGIKVAKLGCKDTAQALASGQLQEIQSASAILENAFLSADERLGNKIDRLEHKAQENERQRAQAQEAARQRLQEEERQREEEAAQRLRQLREKQLQKQPEEQVQDETPPESDDLASQDKRVQEALEKVQRLQLGASVELVDELRGRIDCKLALKLKSSGKMVFVDALGRRVSELLPEELAAHLADGNAAILDYGVAFEDALQRLTKERSQPHGTGTS